MFTRQDKSDFKRSERVIGNVHEGQARRGRYGRGRLLMEWAATEGVEEPAFTNIGRWRVDEASSEGGPVYVPWLTVDIDNVNLVEAYEDACRTVGRLEELGYDLSRVVCSFSGSKGFHIQVDSTQMGLAPFKGPQHARLFLHTWTEDVCLENYYDRAVCTPRSLIRLTGSQHRDTGLYKRSFLAPEFRSGGIDRVMRNVRSEYKPFEWPEGGNILPSPREHLRDVYESAERNYRGRHSSGAYASVSHKGEGVLDTIKYGIREGQEFGPKNFHVGRENAAYVMGCKLIEECESRRVAKEKLQLWNGLNSPPLRHARLEAQWRGAKRTMNKTGR